MLYVFYGADEFRAQEELRLLRRDLDKQGDLANNTVRLGGKVSLGELRSACHSASFFEDQRLVIIKGLQERFSGTRRRTTPRRASANAAAGDFDQFVEVLTTLPATTTVVLLDEKPATAFLGAVSGAATVREFSVLRYDALRQWAADRARVQGAPFSPAAIDRLTALVDGAHLGELATEIDKLATYAVGRQIEVDDVDLLVSGAVQYQIWDLTDAVMAGRADKALGFVETMAARGGRDYAPQLLIFMLTRQYRQLILANAMQRDRVSTAEIGQRLGLSPYPLKKVTDQAARYQPEGLEAAYRRLLQTDVAVKTGVLDVDTALELLIVDLTELTKTPRRPSAPARR